MTVKLYYYYYSPSPSDEPGPSLQRPNSLVCSDTMTPSLASGGKITVLDTGVINDIEKDARRLATDVDAMIENLSCVLQVCILIIRLRQECISNESLSVSVCPDSGTCSDLQRRCL